MAQSRIKPATFWLVVKRNKTAIIFPFPINPLPISHTFDNTQSKLLAVSLYKTQITYPNVHLPSPTLAILHK
jgi:hypothetical protein